jgi:hypothetical protein
MNIGGVTLPSKSMLAVAVDVEVRISYHYFYYSKFLKYLYIVYVHRLLFLIYFVCNTTQSMINDIYTYLCICIQIYTFMYTCIYIYIYILR